MPWYYVGPDAQPVGPLSLDELQSRRGSGAVSPETYVIDAGTEGAARQWRRYREVFPPPPSLPPIPSSAVSGPPPVPHPLFPSAIPPAAAPSPGGPVFTGTHPSNYRRPPPSPVGTNSWCAWGFGLAVAGLFLCGLPSPLGLVASLVGLVQVSRHREQQGRGLAVAGVVISSLVLAILLIVLIYAIYSSLHGGVALITEQTSNDSDTR